jgi:hypothetical protein
MQERKHIDPSLSGALRALAEEDGDRGASAAVEARLLREVRSIGRAKQRRGLMAIAAVAAAVFIAVSVPGWHVSPVPVARNTGAGGDTIVNGGTTDAFIPLMYASVPMTNGQIVRLEVSRSALASYGAAPADVPGDRRSATVLADVLVGEDGLARAVRFVRQE